MSLLVISRAVIRLAGRTLLDRADLTVDQGRRIGLIGRNGVGKSTLLRAIAGEIALDDGEIRLAARARIAQIRQEMPETICHPAGACAAGRPRAPGAAGRSPNTAPPTARPKSTSGCCAIDASSAPARAAAILAGLGFNEDDQSRPLSAFSGGWRMRVALAAALFAAPDLLLLDEPTNHLDLEATMWLEDWLARFPGAALIVSHDRNLLDRAVEAIAHLDRGTISVTPGGFAEFVRIKTERALQQARAAERIAQQRAHIQSFIDRFRYKASKARQAQARVKALERLPVIDAIVEPAPVRFDFPQPSPLARPILVLDRVSVGYDGRPVLRNISLSIDMDDRLALLGANGNGKSTLARLIAGRLESLAGEVRRQPRLRVGYFAQHQMEELESADTPVGHMQRALPKAAETAVRSHLARFGLDADRAGTTVTSLSGGEKARLLLALATRDAPHLLILDEPTNHLDIDAREALVKALASFEGAVILITHDPHLVDLVADRLLLVADGTVQPFDGDLNDYRALMQERARPAARDAAPRRRDERRDRAQARLAQAPLRKRAREAEAAIARLSAERRRVETRLADPMLYAADDAGQIVQLQLRLAEIAREMTAQETAWLEAEEALSETL